MMWLMFAGGLGGGLFLGFTLGVFGTRRVVEDERAKALDMATLLIDRREVGVTHTSHPPPSISLGCTQEFLYEVTFGGTGGH